MHKQCKSIALRNRSKHFEKFKYAIDCTGNVNRLHRETEAKDLKKLKHAIDCTKIQIDCTQVKNEILTLKKT